MCSGSGTLGCENVVLSVDTKKLGSRQHQRGSSKRLHSTIPSRTGRKDGLYTPKEQKEAHSSKQFLPSEMAHICLPLKKERRRRRRKEEGEKGGGERRGRGEGEGEGRGRRRRREGAVLSFSVQVPWPGQVPPPAPSLP